MSRFVKTPTVLQVEAVECGAASLAMILGYHRRFVPLSDLRVDCGVSRDGSKAANILRAARHHGLVTGAKRLEPDTLHTVAMPAILFVNMNHFVVLEGMCRRGFRLNDPALGRRIVSAEAFDEMFTGVVLTFEKGPDFETTPRPAGTLSSLARLTMDQASAAVFVVATGASLAIPALVVPTFTRVFIDDYLMADQTDWLFWLCVLMAGVIALQAGLSALHAMASAKLEAKLGLLINTQMVWRMMRLPIPFFGQRYAGSLASRGQMAAQLSALAGQNLPAVMVGGVSVAVFVTVMVSYEPILTLLVVALLSAGLLLVWALKERVAEVSQKTATELMTLAGKTMVGIRSMENIRACGNEASFFEGWSGTHAHVVNGQASLAFQNALMTATPPFLSIMTKTLVLMLGGWFVMEGTLTVGALIAYLALLTALDGPFQKLVNDVQALAKAAGPLGQVRDILTYPLAREFQNEFSRSEANPPPLSGAVAVKNLKFGYSPLAGPLLQDVSFTLSPGRSIAFVGASGSGKSTVAKLLSGAYEPWDGTIAFDGVPIGEIDRAVLRGSMAVVSQSVTLFEASLRDNIRLWDETISEDAITKAAEDAAVHDILAAAPEGLDTMVTENGRNLSGGQRQRIEIARALAKNPAILILDEATSALDTTTERHVTEAIARRGMSTIVIAHRLSTIRHCDEIVVLDRGRIVQRGTHDAMRQVDGPYRALLAA